MLRPAMPPDRSRLVCFEVAGQTFGAPIDQVKESIVLRPLTRVFRLPPWFAGIVNLRGTVVAVLDLAALFGLGTFEASREARILVARAAGATAGLLVDAVKDVRTVDLGALQPWQEADADGAALGVATADDGTPLVVLDVARLFESDRLRQYQRKAS